MSANEQCCTSPRPDCMGMLVEDIGNRCQALHAEMQTSAQDDAIIARHEDLRQQHAGTPEAEQPVCTYPQCRCPFDAPGDPNWCARGLPKPAKNPPPPTCQAPIAAHIRAMLANGEVRLASDRIARLLDAPSSRHQVQQHIFDLKAAVNELETLVFRMAIERHQHRLDFVTRAE